MYGYYSKYGQHAFVTALHLSLKCEIYLYVYLMYIISTFMYIHSVTIMASEMFSNTALRYKVFIRDLRVRQFNMHMSDI